MSEQDDLMTSAAVSALLGIKPNTLEIWRTKGHGPAFLKLGTAPQAPVRYLRSKVVAWLEQRLYVSTSAYTAALANAKSESCRSAQASV